MTRITVPTKQVAPIAKALGYRKREVVIVATDKVTLHDLNWCEGSRSEFTAIELATGAKKKPDLAQQPPWRNPHEGQVVDLPPGIVVAETGWFCGRVSTLYLYVHPSNMPALLPAS